ncbi:IniB N-terminal domain-containing protein [Nocardia sp. GTS18]|uniref:IniB N-terminal domain-containing protein n=1 Tax=Nocardia sp. GTS18 TaxID=1778064 RepID=UPI0015EF4275|nr:IniB N-terminal domain-containing protein [Nocardia sp. GTS18]
MTTPLENAILQFILDLLRDPKAAAAYCNAPDKVIEEAQLCATPEYIAACAPMVARGVCDAGSAPLRGIVGCGGGGHGFGGGGHGAGFYGAGAGPSMFFGPGRWFGPCSFTHLKLPEN